jgi:hypothetical protein
LNCLQNKVCDGILERFEEAAVPLAEEFGALPVIGIGHSLGALLQVSNLFGTVLQRLNRNGGVN